MKKLRFKTNLKCGGCVNAITPYMNEIEGIESWDVDLNSPNKIVEVVTKSASAEEIRQAIEKGISEAGYTVELMN
jgi:copper chaperone CopZ